MLVLLRQIHLFLMGPLSGLVGRKRIAAEMGVAVGTTYRVALEGSKFGKRFFEPHQLTRRLTSGMG
jgi:hypothetical protein